MTRSPGAGGAGATPDPPDSAGRLLWGDLHNHCAISYGHGSLERALALARQQLDFVSVTGHAFWPDMPTDRTRHGRTIDTHRMGFQRLHAGWDGVLATLAGADREGEFVVFPGYEWHSLAHGDHHVVYRDLGGALLGGETVDEPAGHPAPAGAPVPARPAPHRLPPRRAGDELGHLRGAGVAPGGAVLPARLLGERRGALPHAAHHGPP